MVHQRRRGSVLLIGLALMLVPTSAAAEVAPPSVPPAAEAPPAAPAAGQVGLRFVLGGLSSPTAIVHAGDGSGRLFVAQQGGTVRIVQNGALQPGTFLNISGSVQFGGEQGLLGLAFHPSFETNGKFYAYYTAAGGNSNVVAEFTAGSNSGTAILTIPHPTHANHNGGQIAFGHDGHLYVFTGDGGGSGDPSGNAQNRNSLLGKVLRVSVPGNGTGAPAPGNPYLGGATTADDLVWAYGLRNPWRASFDRATGELWIADVGQGAWEEVNRVPAGTGAQNYGWSDCEGMHNFNGSGCPSGGGRTAPIAEYSLAGSNCAATGGYVYRGSQEAALVGHYVVTDFCSGNLWTIPANGSALTFHGSTGARISSFGESESGELYAVDLASGNLYLVVAPQFSDIADSQFYADINWIVAAGITSGCGNGRYCPDDAVNREQMASFLARAMRLPPASRDYFTDDGASPHQDNINRLAAAGIGSGCGGGRFCPTAEVNREQMASFLARALGLPGSPTDYFWDDASSAHQADINRVANSGIAAGCGGGRYCPLDAVTRGQMAAFLRRAFSR